VRPLVFSLPHALVFWPVIVWGFGTESRFFRRAVKSGGHKSAQDAGSMWVVIMGNNVASFLAFWLAFAVPSAAMSYPRVAFWVGLWIFVAGTLLRRHCFRALGEYFTFDVNVREQHPVIETGAYRHVRHPSYSGGILMFAGVGLAIGNWISFALMSITIVAVYIYRIRMEERALVTTIGQPYIDYMRRTKRFIPGII
jgi:protein-S-isoprenylcysteine O-methyltransferase Ste14